MTVAKGVLQLVQNLGGESSRGATRPGDDGGHELVDEGVDDGVDAKATTSSGSV